MLPRYSDCTYSAFVSYAHADDAANPYWVSKFSAQLQRCLGGRLGNVVAPKQVHLSELNGPRAGTLTRELQDRVARSFAMIIVVGHNYPDSEWCFRELEYFRNRFGADGLEKRLHIVVLSRDAMKRLEGTPTWAALVPSDQVWVSFSSEATPTEPVRTHISEHVLAEDFETRLVALASKLAESIRDDLTRKAPAPAGAEVDPLVMAADPKAKFQVVVGAVTDELEAAAEELQQALRSHRDFSVARVDSRTLLTFRREGDLGSAFGGARVLILPFSDASPLMGTAGDGGHLALQQREWERLGGSRWLVWYRPALAGGDVHRRADGKDAEFISQLPTDIATTERACERLVAILEEGGPAPTPSPTRALVYVESNQIEVDEWKGLSRRIGEVWADITRQSPHTHHIAIRARGLRVHELDRTKHRLDDADGVILLWGHKAEASLRAQINTLEDLLPYDGPLAPGFVAYLIPPHEEGARQAANGWDVFRFRRQDDRFHEEADESDQLRSFLEKILRRKMTREGATP